MAFELIIPNVKPKSIKDGIISLLSKNPPLTVKDLQKLLRKDHRITTKYHAVYQSIIDLKKSGVLKKEFLHYSINKKWIESLEDYVKKIKQQYSEKTDVRFLDYTTTQITFDTLADAATEGVKILYSNFLDVFRTRKMFGQFQHIWPFHATNPQIIQMIKYVMKVNKYYAVVRGDSVPDQKGMAFFKNLGVNIKTGIDCAQKSSILAHGHTATEIFLQEKMSKKLDKLFSSVQDTFDLDFFIEYNNLIKKKSNVTFVITRNKLVAQKIAEETLAYFK